MAKFARRTDANQRTIAMTLRQLGWKVKDVHELKRFCDLVAYKPMLGVRLIEVKTDDGDLTDSQQEMLDDGWPLVILRSVQDALDLV